MEKQRSLPELKRKPHTSKNPITSYCLSGRRISATQGPAGGCQFVVSENAHFTNLLRETLLQGFDEKEFYRQVMAGEAEEAGADHLHPLMSEYTVLEKNQIFLGNNF